MPKQGIKRKKGRWESFVRGQITKALQLTGYEKSVERRQRWLFIIRQFNLWPEDEVFPPCDSHITRSFWFPGIFYEISKSLRNKFLNHNFYHFFHVVGSLWQFLKQRLSFPTPDVNWTQCDHFWLIGLQVYYLRTICCLDGSEWMVGWMVFW